MADTNNTERAEWKLGDEYLPFHPSASHVDPSYRDGWNACFHAGRASLAAGGEPVAYEIKEEGMSSWSPCTRECYEETKRTGRYLGLKNGIACEVRALYTVPQPAHAPGDGWMPVEDAPRGQLMLFCDMNATELRSSFFVDWMVEGSFCGNRHHEATHCRPLPPAPPLSPNASKEE